MRLRRLQIQALWDAINCRGETMTVGDLIVGVLTFPLLLPQFIFTFCFVRIRNLVQVVEAVEGGVVEERVNEETGY